MALASHPVIYREFRPRDELADIVVCTWQRVVPRTGAPPLGRVLPDRCVDLVWRAGALFVAGPDRVPVISPLAAGSIIVGLRLRPGTAGAILGLPARELREARVALEDVWGKRGASLTEQVALAGPPAVRRRMLEDAVQARRAEMSALDPLVLAATRQLGLPGSRVGSLSRALGTSERQLLRRFDASVGYGPKTLDRVLRFQRFLSRAARPTSAEAQLARIAADLGYADQAHLTRECLRLSGLTPTRLAASHGPQSDIGERELRHALGDGEGGEVGARAGADRDDRGVGDQEAV